MKGRLLEQVLGQIFCKRTGNFFWCHNFERKEAPIIAGNISKSHFLGEPLWNFLEVLVCRDGVYG